ncbi:LSU ribosomal protein L29P [Ignicoccus hospitalis KIN4/I]|uniref:Large ribosomal subunit protein uL29 n=1 Tax=Ignicoccus hospitalis (strain KIN4/I / DSM 18386 / JCM 14125) TaxID=453591 RepID=A8AA21_IGNH4|nr:LSU ribosomal protein L29P [Ignicoccus hospitalis KIN4/I]
MTNLKPDEIRKMSREEREQKLKELKSELITLRYQAKMGHIDNPAKIRNIKRTIARILTINREEELGLRRGKQ